MLLFIREMNERVMVIQLALFTRDYNYRVVYVLCTYQWKSPPPPRAKVGECGGFLWYFKARLARGVGDFSGFALHIHRARSGSEVGIGLVPSFHTVLSSRGAGICIV